MTIPTSAFTTPASHDIEGETREAEGAARVAAGHGTRVDDPGQLSVRHHLWLTRRAEQSKKLSWTAVPMVVPSEQSKRTSELTTSEGRVGSTSPVL